MDYGKFKYEQSKKQSNNSNKVELKTIQFRPNTGDHDMDTKLGHAERFLDDGNKVKLVIRIRGRERAYTSPRPVRVRLHLLKTGCIKN